jgi:hypothetical protein
LSCGLGSNDLKLVVGPRADGLVLFSKLVRQLAAASRGPFTSSSSLLVELGNSIIELLLGLLGVG